MVMENRNCSPKQVESNRSRKVVLDFGCLQRHSGVPVQDLLNPKEDLVNLKQCTIGSWTFRMQGNMVMAFPRISLKVDLKVPVWLKYGRNAEVREKKILLIKKFKKILDTEGFFFGGGMSFLMAFCSGVEMCNTLEGETEHFNY